MTNSFTQITQNQFDSQYRIISNGRVSMTYDPVGNRLSKEVSTSGGVIVYVKAYLQGCFDSGAGLMSDKLRESGYIPTDEPYTGLGYTHVGGGGEKIRSVALLTTGTNGLIDWFVVELRDPNDPAIIMATQAVVIQADGDIVSQDGISPVIFDVPEGSYYVSLHHRNHLGVMTAAPVSLTRGTDTTPIDFSNPATATAGTDAQKNINGVMVLWGGNAKATDDYVRATPRIFPPPQLDSDITSVLDDALAGDPNSTFNGYHVADVNMDGKVRMTPLIFPPPGTPSDATFILDEVLNGDPNATREEQQ